MTVPSVQKSHLLGRRNVFETFGVRPVINCCGIYTDLGGSVLTPTVWQAVEELNGSYVRMTDLLDAAGAWIAQLTGAEAARITPGASAAIALAVGATMTGNVGARWEQLPDTTGLKNEVVIAASHLARYKYAVCIRIPGARLVPAGPPDRFDLDALFAAINAATACVFVPAHLLDGFAGVDQLRQVAVRARSHGVPVVVDAAYMSYPTDLIGQYPRSGADLICFSAKYFSGPNPGGFVIGRRQLVSAVEGLDFTRFESGAYRKFGRAFKMSRYDVAATALALREWMTMDHAARWAGYASKVRVLADAVRDEPDLTATQCHFTMSEELIEEDRINCLALRFPRKHARRAAEVAEQLAAGDPIVAAIVEPHVLILAVDALLDGQEQIVAERLVAALKS